MASIVKIISAKRYVNGGQKQCYYIATVQGDDWIYFNDDQFWRCKKDKSRTQVFYIDKQIWVTTENIKIEQIKDFNATAAQNMVNGAGAAAENADVETAVQWAIDKVTNNYITYDSVPRQTAVGDFDALQYDCSSLVITAFIYGGFPVQEAVTTRNMRSVFTAAGFTWYPGTTWEAEDLLRGDILLQEEYHTELYIGNNQDVNCGTTPGAVITHWNYYSNPDFGYYGGWDGILRYEG